MKLSWKDFFTTLLAIIVAVALFAKIREYSWTFLGSWRTAIVSVGILGILMATLDERDFTHFNAWGVTEWIIALAALGFGVAGLIVASKVLFVIFAASVLALWGASIIRHAFSGETETSDTSGMHPAL